MTNIQDTIPGKDIKGHNTVMADVGEDSRRSGRVPVPVLVDRERDSIEKQWRELCAEKKSIEGELTKYSKTALSAAQLKVRNENYGASRDISIAAWISKKSEMDSVRRQLVDRKVSIETEMIILKPRIKQLNQRDDWEENHMHLELLRSIVFELREIKAFLKK